MKALQWLKARLREPSTWGGITLAIGGGCNFPAPFNWLSIGAGIIGVLVKEPEK